MAEGNHAVVAVEEVVAVPSPGNNRLQGRKLVSDAFSALVAARFRFDAVGDGWGDFIAGAPKMTWQAAGANSGT